MASRVASSLESRLPLPNDFVLEVKDKINELVKDEEEFGAEYISHEFFKREMDEQLLQWLKE